MKRDARSSVAAATIAALAFAACGGSNDASVENPESESESTSTSTSAEQDEVDRPPVTQLEAEPDDSSEDEPVDPPGDGTTLADAAPLLGEPIEWADDKFAWSLDLRGLTDIPSDDPNEGTCVALSGTATPTTIWKFTPWTTFSARPLIELQVDGEPIEQTGFKSGGCDTNTFVNAGYLLFEDMFVSLGSPYNFVATFQFESGDIGDVEAVVFTSTDDSEAVLSYYLPTIADGIAPPVPPAYDYSTFTVLAADVGTISIDAAFDLDDTDDHDIEIQGIVAAPADAIGAADSGPGSCLVIVGSMTMTDTAGAFSANGQTLTSMLIGGHRLNVRNSKCDTSEVESAGYQTIAGSFFRAGTSVDFYEAMFVPESLIDTDVLIGIDDHTNRDTRLLMPTMLDTLPAPLALPDTHTVPPTSGSMTAAPISYQDARSGLPEYTMSAIGFFIGDLNQQRTRRCVHFLATVAADGSPGWGSSLKVLSSGQVHTTRRDDCDGTLLESAGYQRSSDAEFVADIAVPVYASFSLPLDEADMIEGLVIGNQQDPDVLLFDPMFIDVIPAI